MDVHLGAGGNVTFKAPQQQWQGSEVYQTALFAGQRMDAITNGGEDGFVLVYLDLESDPFASMEEAKGAAPAFAKAVLQHLITLV
jgi:hypothetical protein